jgi:hypothetical protein
MRLVMRLVIDYSVRRDFVLWPHGLYFSHAMRRDYLSRGNTGSTSNTMRAAATSSSGRIASTIHGFIYKFALVATTKSSI